MAERIGTFSERIGTYTEKENKYEKAMMKHFGTYRNLLEHVGTVRNLLVRTFHMFMCLCPWLKS